MAVTKHPNYLEELLKLKLKESDLNVESKKLSTRHEKFKFSNISEERLNLAVQLAQKDIKELNARYGFNQKRRAKGISASQSYKNSIDFDDDGDDQPNTRCSCHKDLPLRTMSPPIRDENSEPKTKKSILKISEREASAELKRSKEDLLRLVRQIQVLASLEVREASDDDPTEAERRKMRIGERTNRISRLTYDLGRGTRYFLTDLRRGRRQDCLKKLLHFYKESTKVLKMVVMQMSDSYDPPSFLRSKIFQDLTAILSDLSFSAVELDVDLSTTGGSREPAVELKRILDLSGSRRKVHFPQPPPPPCTPQSDQDCNNNVVRLQLCPRSDEFPSRGDEKSELRNAGKTSSRREKEVRAMERRSMVEVDDADSRRQLLKKCLLLLMEKNLQSDGRIGKGGGGNGIRLVDGDIKDRINITRPKNVTSGNKLRKVPRKAHRSEPLIAPIRRARLVSSGRRGYIAKTVDGATCSHPMGIQNTFRRSKSSPPRMSKKTTSRDGKESIAEDYVLKLLKLDKSDDLEGSRTGPGSGSALDVRRSRSLSRHVICPNCGTRFENRHDFDRLVIVHEGESSGRRGDSESDDSSKGFRNSGFEAPSTLTSSDIRMLERKLKEFEIERAKIKERWPSQDVGGKGESLPVEPLAVSDKSWIKDFEKEFRKDVADTKDIFHHLAAGGESTDFGRTDDFSAKLLQDWNRRDREFFSFRLFNGESHDGAVQRPMMSPRFRENGSVESRGGRIVEFGNIADQNNEERIRLASKMAGSTVRLQPIDLAVDRKVLGEVLARSGELKGQVKEGILRLLNSRPGDPADHAFVSSRMANDLLEDCMQQVCNEADFVSNEIVNRVYESELAAAATDS